MLKLSSCIEIMFTESPFVDRIKAAKDAGFDAWEFWGWSNKDIPALKDAMADVGLPVAACSISAGDEALAKAFSDGNMLKAKNASLFAEIIQRTVEGVAPLGLKTFIATVGNTLPDATQQSQHYGIIACLQAAEPVLRKHGATLVLEPLNPLVDHKGYYLGTSKEAFEILEAVNSKHVKMLFDIYHQQITEGNLTDNINAYISRIGHFHLADVPGRHQPGTGEINYQHVFGTIAANHYNGYIGCEYRPTQGVSSEESAQLILKLGKEA